jgi:hypothetical protein
MSAVAAKTPAFVTKWRSPPLYRKDNRMTKIDRTQMRRDFETIPEPVDGAMRRARRIVEEHIAAYGMVPHPDKMKEAIATELALVRLLEAKRANAS